ncbi:MAG: type II toxin-antitoxin system RelE/ParE family toxin [Betaproteobacteria bacterium]|nr:MAG: type II toxin-antitoxin system RelE/ParE family toxin [Betaproteobacteria bacterium]
MKAVLSAEALREAHDAAAYLERQRAGLGSEFADEVELGLEMITARPTSWKPLTHGLRRYRIKRFRYNLIYRLRDNQAEVIAVAHDRQRPGYWLPRVD